MDKKETYDRLRTIAVLKLIQGNASLSVKTRVDAGILKVKKKLTLNALRTAKAKDL